MKTATNKLQLKKCAYLFHWSNETHTSGTLAQIEEKHEQNKILKSFYDNIKKCDQWLDYRESGEIKTVTINNHDIVLNDLMIKATTNKKDLVNNINYFKFVNKLNNKDFTINTSYNKNDDGWAWHKKFKTLHVENFQDNTENLGYIRLHFKNNSVSFVIDNQGKLYYKRFNNLEEFPESKIYKKLGIESPAARKELATVLKTIREANQEANNNNK